MAAPSGPEPPRCRGLTITFRHTTFGRTPLDKWDSTQRSLPHNTQHSKQTSMSPAGLEPAIPASERQQIHVLDRAASGIGCLFLLKLIFNEVMDAVMLLLSECSLFIFPIIKYTGWGNLIRTMASLQSGECRKSGLVSDRSHKFLFFPERTDLLRGPSCCLLNGYRGHLPCRASGRGVKITHDNHWVFSIRMNGAKSSLPHMSSWNAKGKLSYFACLKCYMKF